MISARSKRPRILSLAFISKKQKTNKQTNKQNKTKKKTFFFEKLKAAFDYERTLSHGGHNRSLICRATCIVLSIPEVL